MIYSKQKHTQQGFSLIELMIALIIGLVLTGGAIQIFISSKATYRLESALARMQETGRYIVDAMAKDIRMAGYTGCSSRGNITPTVMANNPPPVDTSPSNAITGFSNNGNTWQPVLPVGLAGFVNTGTDVITLQRASECGANLTGQMGVLNANVQIFFPNTCGFVQNQAVIISDCTTADIFQVTNNPGSPGGNTQTLAHSNAVNTGNNLSKLYGPDASISRYISNTYHLNAGAAGEPALWIASWDPVDPEGDGEFTNLELADGVEDMQITYGIDNGSGGNDYVDIYVTGNFIETDAGTAWSDVKSVRINLLLRSADRVTAQPRTIVFNGDTINDAAAPPIYDTGTPDRRLRMVYTSTIAVRNRLP